MIKYTLPDFTVGLQRNLFFINLWRNHPAYFIDDLQIESVYGCFPSCILNGGRTFIRETYSSDQIEQTFAQLAELDITIRLTFTNMLAKVEHLNDPYVKLILDKAAAYNTEVIVYSDELASEIKHRYGFKCVLSTTRGIEDIDTFNQVTKQYDYVVLGYNQNKDYSFIEQIEDRHKIEVMVNEFCQYNCAYRTAHYLHNSKDQMANTMRPFPCHHQEPGTFFEHAENHPVFLTDNQVVRMHRDYGIDYFKIVGRGIPTETVLEAYTYYLVKPEHRKEVSSLYQYASNQTLARVPV